MFALIIGVLFSFMLSLVSLPILMKIAETNSLFVPKGYRHVHHANISSLGGIAIFISSTLAFVLFSDIVNYPDYKYILSSAILMFAIGIRDDLYSIRAHYKLIGQIAAVSLLVAFAGVQIEFIRHFIDGNIGIYADIILSIAIMVVIINAYNLIDGIDMLAALVGIIILGSLGVWFSVVGQIDYGLALLTISSALVAFMIFNYSPAKIFMGDTGTLTIALIMSISLVKFEEINHLISSPYIIHNAPAISFAFISLISFDLFRVAFIRLSRNIHVFTADKNHIHHLLLRLGYSHNKTAYIIASFIILQLAVSLIADRVVNGNFQIIAINIALIITFYTIIYRLLKAKSNKTKVANL